VTAYLSTSCFPNLPVGEAIAACRALGRHRVELSAPHPRQPLPDLEALLRATVADRVELTLHNYFPAPKRPIVLNLASDEAEERAAGMALVTEAARLSRAAQAKVYAVHAGYVGKARPGTSESFRFEGEDGDIVRATDRAIATLADLLPLFGGGTRLAVENLFPSASRRHSLMCDADELATFMDRVPGLGWLLDLGHLNVSATLLDFSRDAYLDRALERYGDRLLEVHLSENGGRADEHLPIAAGSWQLDALKRIRQIAAGPHERVYCVESRHADGPALRRSLDLVDHALA
jgi:sugar phosphate isomerase/epimerase